MMLLLYVDDLLLTQKEEIIKDATRRLAAEFEIKDLGMMHYVIGMEVWTREVCSRDTKEVQDDGLQGHDHTYGIKPKAIECFFIRVGGCHESGIILGANFIPVGYFSMFFSQKRFAILHFVKPCFAQF